MRKFLVTTVATLGLMGPAWAADLALVVGNEDYNRRADVSNGDDVIDAARLLERQGFDTVVQEDASAIEMADAIDRFVRAAPDADGIAVVLSGRFVHTLTEAWLLPVDAPSDLKLADLPRTALPMSTVMAILADYPGRALLVIGHRDGSDNAGRFLTEGTGPLNIPQGVTVLTGDPRATGSFAQRSLTVAGRQIVQDGTRRYGLTASGFAPETYTFVPIDVATPPEPVVDEPVDDSAAEAAFWAATREADTITAYQRYINRYPDGQFVAEATRLITEIRSEPYRAARLAEEALGLTRDQRRTIQRQLSILDYDTRGIDGIFGRGTRTAITNWQKANGLEGSGYLSRNQILQLTDQADRRAAQLEAEAEARRLQQERDDRAYWDQTGAAGDEAGLRAYLKRYPDGVFAELANERLQLIEDRRRNTAERRDREAWETATRDDTIASYNDYLQNFPRGAFREEAGARIEELREESRNSEAVEQARAQEDALNLSQVTKRLIEGRLEAMGLQPGPVDGQLDDQSRRAIRRYQTARNLTPTGYLTQDTVVRLLADSIFQ